MSITITDALAAQNASIKSQNRALVRTWLYCTCLLIFVMVIVGGATRLTDSGLSITEWQPLLGAIPPLSAADWQIAFDKYREIPEYTQINKGMSLAEFQFIYWWEWAHRFLGRLIGLFVAIPLAYFWITGRLESFLKPRLVLLFALGGLQGFIGWWMVKSGLVERVDVSQYRLAIHLTLACVIFAYAMWLARGLAVHSDEPVTPRVSTLAIIGVFFVVLQIFLGALVAGLDAGFAFNDWPTMDGAFVPSDLWVQSPWWINAFENPKTVQFIHRLSAYVVLAFLVFQMVIAYQSESGDTHKRRTAVLLGLGALQAAIGIVTLVLQVPLSWALLHQGGAVVLLGFAVAHWRGIRGEFA